MHYALKLVTFGHQWEQRKVETPLKQVVLLAYLQKPVFDPAVQGTDRGLQSFHLTPSMQHFNQLISKQSL